MCNLNFPCHHYNISGRYVKECLEKLAGFKKIVIVDTAGISSMYANDGGIIIAV